MHDFDFDAERLKLERVLSLGEGELGFLSSLHSTQLRQLREEISEKLHARHQDSFSRLARLSRVLPIGASAKLAETVLGSMLGAGVAGEMDPDRAAKLSGKLSPAFLAKLCVHLEPHRAAAIIREVPDDIVVAIARELIAKQEFITLARFVTQFDQAVLSRVMDAIQDDEALLRIGIFVEQRDALNDLVAPLSEARRQAVLKTATDADLWPQTLVLLTHLSDAMKGAMGDAAVAMGKAQIAQVIEVTRDHNLWEPLIITIANMREENRRQVLAQPLLQDKDTVAALLRDIDSEHLWTLLAKVWLDAPEQTLACAFEVILAHRHWLADLMRETHAAGRADQLRSVIERLPASLREQVEVSASEFAPDDFAAVMA